ncbi:MAG: aconitate hydratase [Candidatus Margulisiibacteriota bacterium]|jgi:aconitate hydratase
MNINKNLVQKILNEHCEEGDWTQPGNEIGIRIDQCLTQDSTGTMAWLEFESLGLDKVRSELAVSYCDHTSLSFKGESADDHAFLKSIANRFGAIYSKAGNGVCHQIHYERFGVPGKTLLGSDSHTPTGGGLGMLAIGAGGMDVAVAMAGGLFYLQSPQVLKVSLSGELAWGCDAKDVILEILRRLTVTGGVNKVIEYTGKGVRSLSVPQRTTITNMGAELGATSSVFPSDEITKAFLTAQNRGKDYRELGADEYAKYEEEITINLFNIEPMVAMPYSPDNVHKVSEVAGEPVNQVVIGSCTNGSYREIKLASEMLRGKKVNSNVDLIVVPGSRQVQQMLLKDGSIDVITDAGGRLIDPGCGPCIGMGFVPGNGQFSLRTVNRNWQGRGGNKNAKLALCSVEVAAASAIAGKISDPREIKPIRADEPSSFFIDDSMLLFPKNEKVEIVRGPNIVPIKKQTILPAMLNGEILLKVGDGISTDDILPAGPLTQHLRSNLPQIAKFVFHYIDGEFAQRAVEKQGGFIVGGTNYGQGSSREHAALAPKELGIKAVLAKSFARIHRDNLINSGIVPLICHTDQFKQGEILELDLTDFYDVRIRNKNTGKEIAAEHNLSFREIAILKAGGVLAYAVQ